MLSSVESDAHQCVGNKEGQGHPAGRLGVGVQGDLHLQVLGAGDLQPALSQLQQVRALSHTTHAVVINLVAYSYYYVKLGLV